MLDDGVLEIKKINEFVDECLELTNVTDAYLYGIDSNGYSIKLSLETVRRYAIGNYETVINELQRKCNTNTRAIGDLYSALAQKSNVGHTHTISDVNGLQSALEGKSNVGHTHTISDVQGLGTRLGDLETAAAQISSIKRTADDNRTYINYISNEQRQMSTTLNNAVNDIAQNADDIAEIKGKLIDITYSEETLIIS